MMERERALKEISNAIDALAKAIESGVSNNYRGIERILQELRMMKKDIEVGNSRLNYSGIGRQVIDQWPFSELGESVLSANEAYIAFRKKETQK